MTVTGSPGIYTRFPIIPEISLQTFKDSSPRALNFNEIDFTEAREKRQRGQRLKASVSDRVTVPYSI